MDLATAFCPNPACSARGQSGQGNLGIHSRKEQRFICTLCGKTFTTTKGTAFYRLRTPAETVSLVLTLLAHGCPLQAMGPGIGPAPPGAGPVVCHPCPSVVLHGWVSGVPPCDPGNLSGSTAYGQARSATLAVLENPPYRAGRQALRAAARGPY
jgi:hypothetical protein